MAQIGNDQNPAVNGNAGGGILSIAMRSGKWGAVGLAFASIGELVQFFMVGGVEHLNHFFAWGGAAIGLWGLAAHAKRGTDMAVSVAVDASKDRAMIINALTPPNVVDVVPTSSDPAVQHEIDKRLTK